MWRALHDFGFLSAPSSVKSARLRQRMSPIDIVIFLMFIAALLFSSNASAVIPGFGKKTEVHLSPEVKGVVTLNGTPVEGAGVVKTLDFDQEYRDEQITDKDGRFAFPEKNIRSERPNTMLDETRVRQIVTVTYKGQKYLLWYATPGTIHRRAAVTRKLSLMYGELTSPETEQGFENVEKPQFPHSAFSVCRWSG